MSAICGLRTIAAGSGRTASVSSPRVAPARYGASGARRAAAAGGAEPADVIDAESVLYALLGGVKSITDARIGA
jgi:hypothetical protein